MKESFKNEHWKEDLEREAAAVPEFSEEDINKVIRETEAQMAGEEGPDAAARSIPETIKELELRGWHYLGPATPELMYKAIVDDGKEIKVVGAGVFEKEKEK